MVAYIVNKVLDGDTSLLSSLNDKVISGKSKAYLIKINKGSMDRPAMPDAGSATAAPGVAPASAKENDEDLMKRLVADGIAGKMDEINSLDNKILRAKIKSAIIKSKKSK